MLNISAIDVGSNAMRMVIGEVDESWQINTIENIRLPVRLGQDVFSKGYLEEKTLQQTEEAFLHFKHVAESFNIHHLRAVATSTAERSCQQRSPARRVFRTRESRLKYQRRGAPHSHGSRP
jgi:exopolyphosphatase/pppGpp-phosphohydrolase